MAAELRTLAASGTDTPASRAIALIRAGRIQRMADVGAVAGLLRLPA